MSEGKYPGESSTKTCGPPLSADSVPTNPDALVTPVEARDVWGIPLARIHQWQRRKKITVKGRRGRSALYSGPALRELNRLSEFDPRSGKRSTAS